MEERSGKKNYIAAFTIGIVITVMIIFNTEFGRLTSSEVSITINQIVGIVILSAIMLVGRNNEKINPPKSKAPWWMYFGGFFGIVILTINYVSVLNTGATVAMAGTVFGQSLMGLICDMTGLFGMEKQRIGRKRILGLTVSLSGILLMFIGGKINILYLILAMLAGAITMTQMIYNSNLGKRKGAFYSANVNVISGLVAALLYAFIFYPERTIEGFKMISSVPFFIMIGGGALACIVVVGSNIIIPRIPAVHSALLISSGQILSAVVIDAILYHTFTIPLFAGALLMIAGLAIKD